MPAARESSLLQAPRAQPIAEDDPLHAVVFVLKVAARDKWAPGERTEVLGALGGEAS